MLKGILAMSSSFGIDFEGYSDMLQQLRSIEGKAKETVEKALIETQKYIAGQADKYTNNNNLPAKGKYSTGETKEAIINDGVVTWAMDVATVETGFDLKNTLAPLYLMVGTPTMPPAKGLQSNVKGTKAKNEVKKLQERIFTEEMERIMND